MQKEKISDKEYMGMINDYDDDMHYYLGFR